MFRKSPSFWLLRPLLLLGTLALSVGFFLPASLVFAKKNVLSPAKVKQIKKTNKSFNNCRKDALAALKEGNVSKKKFEVMLSTCQENFPGASLYVACKKEAVHIAQEGKLAPDEATAQCKRYLLAASFDPAEPFPYFAEKGQLYFAGIGLNKDAPVKGLKPPNFDCQRLREIAAKPKDALYVLFGNHPSTFSSLTKKTGPELATVMGFEKSKKNGLDIPGFGRLFGNPTGDKAVVYFPLATCDFDGSLGSVFSGLSSYYLLDLKTNQATPYFGIAYFDPDQTTVTTNLLIQQTIKGLTNGGGGATFKTYIKGGDSKNVTFISSHPVAETDEEHDPKNVCRSPRDNRFLAIVQGNKDQPTHPEYIIVANIKNLCDFGDKLARRLAE